MQQCLFCNPCLVLKTRARYIVVSMNIGNHIYLLFIFTGKASLMVLMRTKKKVKRGKMPSQALGRVRCL